MDTDPPPRGRWDETTSTATDQCGQYPAPGPHIDVPRQRARQQLPIARYSSLPSGVWQGDNQDSVEHVLYELVWTRTTSLSASPVRTARRWRSPRNQPTLPNDYCNFTTLSFLTSVFPCCCVHVLACSLPTMAIRSVGTNATSRGNMSMTSGSSTPVGSIWGTESRQGRGRMHMCPCDCCRAHRNGGALVAGGATQSWPTRIIPHHGQSTIRRAGYVGM